MARCAKSMPGRIAPDVGGSKGSNVPRSPARAKRSIGTSGWARHRASLSSDLILSQPATKSESELLSAYATSSDFVADQGRLFAVVLYGGENLGIAACQEFVAAAPHLAALRKR